MQPVQHHYGSSCICSCADKAEMSHHKN